MDFSTPGEAENNLFEMVAVIYDIAKLKIWKNNVFQKYLEV